MKISLVTACFIFLLGIERSSGQNFIAVKTSLTEYFDGNHPTANLSAEIYLGKKFSIQPAIGVCLPNNYYDDTHQEGLTGRIELKKYWWWKNEYETMTGPYFSIDLFMADFILDKKNINEVWIPDIDSSQGYVGGTKMVYEEDYKQYIKSFRTHLKLGYQKKFCKHFVLDLYSGLGTKYKDIHQKDLENHDEDDLQWMFRSISYSTGWYIDVTFGARIGCIF